MRWCSHGHSRRSKTRGCWPWRPAAPAPAPEPSDGLHLEGGGSRAIGEASAASAGVEPWSAGRQALHQFRPLLTSLCPLWGPLHPPSHQPCLSGPLQKPAERSGSWELARPRGTPALPVISADTDRLCRDGLREPQECGGSACGERRARVWTRHLSPPSPPWTCSLSDQLVKVLLTHTPSPGSTCPLQAGGCHSFFVLSRRVRGRCCGHCLMAVEPGDEFNEEPLS